IGHWDNASPYTGEIDSWAHRLKDNGQRVTSIGKLHYRNDEDDVGFTDIHHSLHVKDGVGDVYPLIRDNMKPIVQNRDRLLEAGPGSSSYTRFDEAVADQAVNYLKKEASNEDEP